MLKKKGEYERLAADWVAAQAGDECAQGRLNEHYERAYTLADTRAEIWGRVYSYRQRSSKVEKNWLELGEARMMLAQEEGFGSWEELAAAAEAGGEAAGPGWEVDEGELTLRPRRRLTRAEWGCAVEVMRERGVRRLEARGLLTDAVLGEVARVECLRHLDLSGCRGVSAAGLRALAGMPWLEGLELNGYAGGGLEVLGELTGLRELALCWASGATDDGLRELSRCGRLESVNLMGTATGDGALEALRGKAGLRRLSTGRLTTDAGLEALRAMPALGQVLLDGPFTDAGLAGLAGLEGIEEVDLFWHVTEVTEAGFDGLARLPRLAGLGCDGRLATDGALARIGRMPVLKRLRIQESVATDAGFEALGRSETIEEIWGRVCEGFGDRGFRAFGRMPALRKLGIGLGGVSREALAALKEFPALRELTPIGLGDDGFAEVGRCAALERLVCMYCRGTTDAATELIRELRLKSYYAGLTKITDRSLEILGRMPTLEEVELYECLGVTDAGLAALARGRGLKRVSVSGSPGVTLEGTKVFGAGVQVRHSN